MVHVTAWCPARLELAGDEPWLTVLEHDRPVRELTRVELVEPTPAGQRVEPFGMQPPVDLWHARLAVVQVGPERHEHGEVVAAALGTGTMPGCERRGLVEEEQLGVPPGLHERCAAPAPELEPARDPAPTVVRATDQALAVVEAAAVPVDRSAGRVRDQLAERGDPVATGHRRRVYEEDYPGRELMTENGQISALTRPGAVHLTVTDLDRSVAYYGEAIGLRLLARGPGLARIGAGDRELLVLVEEPDARPGRGYTGLFHVAYLVPDRVALATWLAHGARDRVSLVGLSDHRVSEAIYLSDPDGHGIEIYADRPRELWEGQVGSSVTTLPLDVPDLLGVLDDPEATPFAGLPDGTVVGHVHLKVASIPDAVVFYRDVVGLGLMAQLGDQAAFLGAGGYHHHVGANTWESAGAGPPPPGTAALRHATLVLPDTGERERVVARLEHAGYAVNGDDEPSVVDPSGNRLVLAVK